MKAFLVFTLSVFMSFNAGAVTSKLLEAGGAVQPLAAYGSSARGTALGTGYTAVATGTEALMWNPGGLARMDSFELSMHHSAWLVDTFQDTLVLGLPLGKKNGLALGLQYSGYGEFEIRNSLGEVVQVETAHDMGASLAWGKVVHPSLSLGIAVKGQRAVLGDASLMTFAGDTGILWHVPIYGLKMGFAVNNLGLSNSDGRVPGVYSFGVSRPINPEGNLSVNVMGGVKVESLETHRLGLGTEIGIYQTLFLRGAYTMNIADNTVGGLHGLTLGAGFSAEGLSVQYAWIPFGVLGNVHRISMNWTLRDAKKKPAENQFTAAQAKAMVATTPEGEIEERLLARLIEDKTNAFLWYELGKEYRRKQKIRKMIWAFEKALEYQPSAKLEEWLQKYKNK